MADPVLFRAKIVDSSAYFDEYRVILEIRAHGEWRYLSSHGHYRKLRDAQRAAREYLTEMRTRFDEDPDKDLVEIITEDP